MEVAVQGSGVAWGEGGREVRWGKREIARMVRAGGEWGARTPLVTASVSGVE